MPSHKAASPGAITTPIITSGEIKAAPASPAPAPEKSTPSESTVAPRPAAVNPPKNAPSVSTLPTPKTSSSIGPTGRPPLSASQMIRPAGLKVPAKYVPPSGFRPAPPPPQFPTTANKENPNSPQNFTPPKPKQVLSSSPTLSGEPLPPPNTSGSPTLSAALTNKQPATTPNQVSSTTQTTEAPTSESTVASPPDGVASPASVSSSQAPESSIAPQSPSDSGESATLDLNSCSVAELLRIPNLPRRLAEAIVQYRETHGAFRALEDLLQVPEMTPVAYAMITGQEAPPNYKHTKNIRQLLSIPQDQTLTAKLVVEKIAGWPDVVGCVLSNKDSSVIASHLMGTLSAEKIAQAAAQFLSFTQNQLEPLQQSQAPEIIIPGPSASFCFMASNKVHLTLIYSVMIPPARHLEILRAIISQIEV
ncbi:MAG: helix-hairpin-helix domain-containing protein [Verrucomicrobiae bacterium]|nr:helix-hairpin-helix domain-containing protein [Verrucomicrobiae bacterium]